MASSPGSESGTAMMEGSETPVRPSGRKPYKITRPREKWTQEEHNRFVEALERYGRDWKSIVEHVGTRSVSQVRSHGQKHFLKLEKAGNTGLVPPMKVRGRKESAVETSSATLPCSRGPVGSGSPSFCISPQLRVRAPVDNTSATADSGESSHFHHPPSARSRMCEVESADDRELPGASPCVFALVAAPPIAMLHSAAPTFATLPIATSGFPAVQHGAGVFAPPHGSTSEFLPSQGAAPPYAARRGNAADDGHLQGAVPRYSSASEGMVEAVPTYSLLQGPPPDFTPIQRATPAYALLSARNVGPTAIPCAPVIVATQGAPAAASLSQVAVLPGMPGVVRPLHRPATVRGPRTTATAVKSEGLCGVGGLQRPLPHNPGFHRQGSDVLPAPTLHNAGFFKLHPGSNVQPGLEQGQGPAARVAPNDWHVPPMTSGSSNVRLVPGLSMSEATRCFQLSDGLHGSNPRVSTSEGPVVTFSPFHQVDDPAPPRQVERCHPQNPASFYSVDRQNPASFYPMGGPVGASFLPLGAPCSASAMLFQAGSQRMPLQDFTNTEDCNMGARHMFPPEGRGTARPDFSQSEARQMSAQDFYPVKVPSSSAADFDTFAMSDFCGMEDRQAMENLNRFRFDEVRPAAGGGARGSLDSYLVEPHAGGNLCFRPASRPPISGCASAPAGPAGADRPLGPQLWLPAASSSGAMGMAAPCWPSSQGFGPRAGHGQCISTGSSMDIPIHLRRVECENQASNKVQASLPWSPPWDLEGDKGQLQMPAPMQPPGSMHLSAGPSVPMFHMQHAVAQAPTDPRLQPGQRRVYCVPHAAPHGAPHGNRRMPLEMLRMPSHHLVRSASLGNADTKEDADIFREMATALC